MRALTVSLGAVAMIVAPLSTVLAKDHGGHAPHGNPHTLTCATPHSPSTTTLSPSTTTHGPSTTTHSPSTTTPPPSTTTPVVSPTTGTHDHHATGGHRNESRETERHGIDPHRTEHHGTASGTT